MQAQAFRPPIKILLFAANPNATERLRIDREFRQIRIALRAEEQSGAVELEQRTAGRPEDLQDALLHARPHIVHFSGHGTASEELLLEESGGEARRVSKKAFAHLFGILKDRIRLVVLNACHSKPIAEAVGEHIQYAIGMEDALFDGAAVDFAVALYKGIAFGKSVQDAFNLGRNALHLDGLDDADVPALITRIVGEERPATIPVAKSARSPVQVLFILDLNSDTPVARDEVEVHLPDQRSERHVFFLSKYGARTVQRGIGVDFSGCADALVRMVADARSRFSSDGPPVRYYVAGRAALPVFTHLGMELSAWADVTLINQRKSLAWDVLSFQGQHAHQGDPFFKVVKGLDLDEPSEADGRVAVFISTGHVAKRAEIHEFLRAHNSSIAGFIEVRAEQSTLATLDAQNAALAMNELSRMFERLPNAFPRRQGVALFVAGPATLAFMAGRAVTLHSIQDVWVPNYESGAYQFAAVLPWKGRARAQVSEEAHDELARKRLLESILERIHTLQRTLRIEHLPPALSPEEADRFLARLSAMRIDSELRGDDFELNIIEGSMVFGRGLIEALRVLPEADRVRAGQSLFLHELFHFDQNLRSATYHGVGRAGVALEEVDYWADGMTVATLAAWEIHRGGEAGKERAREITVAYVDAVLSGIEAFDRFEQGGRIESLYERRLRRYLIWHLQRVRAQSLMQAEQLWELLGRRLIVELAPLRGRLDERFDKMVDAPQESAEIFVVLGGKLMRSRVAAHAPSVILEAVRTFDRKVLGQAMRALREQHSSLLVPWAR
ncbi:SAVED domain-containing protein [Sorangium sp. So ce269]